MQIWLAPLWCCAQIGHEFPRNLTEIMKEKFYEEYLSKKRTKKVTVQYDQKNN